MMSNISHSDTYTAAVYKAMWEARGKRLLYLAGICEQQANENDKLRSDRDALARRCAEQAKHIAGLISLQQDDAAEADRHPLADAIAVMQRSGIR